MAAYYNEIEPYAAQWLRNLIAAGQIAPGDVDERDIRDVKADDLRGYKQAHFFAGIGGWSVALRLAGWPDDRPVWTGSCPCQPFSSAGAGKAADDSRHLWPAWFPLIAERHPSIVFGEQVEAAIGWGWIDAVFSDLEAEGYACGTTVLPACGVGAPHIRQRLWFVAHTDGGDASTEGIQRSWQYGQRAQDGRTGELGDATLDGSGTLDWQSSASARRPQPAGGSGFPFELGDSDRQGRQGRQGVAGDNGLQLATAERTGGAVFDLALSAGSGRNERPQRTGIENGRSQAEPGRLCDAFWSHCEWLACTDGKSRPVEPGSFPLAHGIQRRPSKLRAYGNAIVPQVAAEFIGAVM